MHPAPRSRRSRIAAIGALALTAALVTGCGDSDDSDKDSAGDDGSTGEVLTEEQLAAAALSIDNLPEGWEETEPDDDDDEPTGTCFDDMEMDEGAEPDAELERSFEYGGNVPQIDSGVASFADEDVLVEQFQRVRDVAADCTQASYTDADGVAFDLTLSVTDGIAPEGADEQLDLRITGSFSTPEGQSADFVVWGALIRIGNAAVNFGYTDLSDSSALSSTYLPIVVGKLQAVLAGETPAETVAPAPA